MDRWAWCSDQTIPGWFIIIARDAILLRIEVWLKRNLFHQHLVWLLLGLPWHSPCIHYELPVPFVIMNNIIIVVISEPSVFRDGVLERWRSDVPHPKSAHGTIRHGKSSVRTRWKFGNNSLKARYELTESSVWTHWELGKDSLKTESLVIARSKLAKTYWKLDKNSLNAG